MFSYIHRIHEVDFLNICPIHKVKLVRYKAHNKYSYRNLIGFSLDDIEGLELNQTNNEVESNLSLLTNEVINLPMNSKVFLEEIIQTYRQHLMMQGYLTKSQKIRLNHIKTDMTKHDSNTIFESLFYELNDRLSDKWIGRVFRYDRLISPLYHLIMINFLANSFSNFMSMSDHNLMFSNPPWPCLNPVCREYLISNIYECQTYWSGMRLVMKVMHNCGFTYLKYSDSVNAKNIYAYDRVTSYGDQWLKRLNYYVHNTDLPVRVIARRLNCDSNTVNNHIENIMGHNEIIE